MEKIYTLSQALQWMKDNRSYDNRRWFEQVYRFQNWGDEEELSDYLYYIESETLEWFKKTPTEWVAEKTLKNAMTGINSLLKNSSYVKQIIGEKECERIIKAMSTTLNTKSQDIINYKKVLQTIAEPEVNEIVSEKASAEEDENEEDDLPRSETAWKDEYDELHRLYVRQQDIIKENNLIIKRLQKKNLALIKFAKAAMPDSHWDLVNEMMEL
jgi:hypothetical protein